MNNSLVIKVPVACHTYAKSTNQFWQLLLLGNCVTKNSNYYLLPVLVLLFVVAFEQIID
jgi:hypothetical protein